jgi:hypothetical protein
MTVVGTFRTSSEHPVMSANKGKADIPQLGFDFRF